MKIQHASALAILVFCTAAAAQPYGVVSVGVSHLGVDCEGVASCDKTDVGGKVIGGYKFAPNWAAEIGWFEYGKATAGDMGVSVSIRNTALGFGAAYHQDLTADWNAVARFGLARVETKLSGSVSGVGSASDTDKNTTAYLGMSVGYRLSQATTLELAWDYGRSKFNKYGIDESGGIHVLSIGLSSGF
jgi:OmpA-OmpF porin, OOP family